jgi:erythromycin esterase
MATILVAMVGYSILFGGLRLILQIIPDLSSWAIGTFGLFFAVVAIGQAVAIRWNNPRAASVIAGTVYWVFVAAVMAVTEGFRNPCEIFAMMALAAFFGPFFGYLAGTLVGGVFLISHYLRESDGLRRRAPVEDENADSPWGAAIKPPRKVHPPITLAGTPPPDSNTLPLAPPIRPPQTPVASMSHAAPNQGTIDAWIIREATQFNVNSHDSFNPAVDALLAALGEKVELLGFGEALHGGEEILALRNRLFQRLVEAHGFTAIALESSLPRSRIVNDYVAGRGPGSYEEVKEVGFDNNFGRLEVNRRLVDAMRAYNADPNHQVKIRFYGFDMPVGTTRSASPRQALQFALDFLAATDAAANSDSRRKQRQRIDELLGPDAPWENPAAYADPTQSLGLTPVAAALRIETEDLVTELRTRRPELVAASDEDRYLEALQFAAVARDVLSYHAAIARQAGANALLGIRDALMADNLMSIVAREQSRCRGHVLAFAHNAHLQRSKAVWPWYEFWPAGSIVHQQLGPAYAVIGSAIGVSEANGVGPPEPGTLEAKLTAGPGPAAFIPTHRGQGLSANELAALPTRSGSATNLSYAGLTAQSLADFDALAVLHSTAYSCGGPPL